jgi:hypothetical protein
VGSGQCVLSPAVANMGTRRLAKFKNAVWQRLVEVVRVLGIESGAGISQMCPLIEPSSYTVEQERHFNSFR